MNKELLRRKRRGGQAPRHSPLPPTLGEVFSSCRGEKGSHFNLIVPDEKAVLGKTEIKLKM